MNFEKNTLGKNYEKTRKNNFHRKKLLIFLIFQKHKNPKTNSLQPIGYPDGRKTKDKS